MIEPWESCHQTTNKIFNNIQTFLTEALYTNITNHLIKTE